MWTHRKSLGLAISEQAVTAAEVELSAAGATLLHTAVVPFTPAAGLDKPDELGKALKQALRQAGIHTTRCAIGLAATFLASREKLVPTTDDASLRGLLTIAAEREFASGPQELVFDYAPAGKVDKNLRVLLMTVGRRTVEQITAAATAAGLTVQSIVPSAVALAAATAGPISPSGRLVLNILPDGAELSGQGPEGVRMVRRFAAGKDNPGAANSLPGELRRVLALWPPLPEGEAPRDLMIWNANGQADARLRELAAMGVRPKLCTPGADLAISGAPVQLPTPSCVEAIAVACGTARKPAIDFAHSRLATAKAARFGRNGRIGIAAAAVLLVGCVALLVDYIACQNEVSDLKDQAAALKAPAQEARSIVETMSFVRTWYDLRAPLLDGLREIAQAFPDDPKVWAVSVTANEDMQIHLTGSSVNEAAAMEVLDRLKSNPKLTDVKPLYLRQSGGATREVSFAVSLALRGAK